MPHTAIHAFVSGRVQGVWFRAFTRAQAKKYSVQGWARNLADGRVEVQLEGAQQAVEQVLNALHKGPRLAKVKEIIKEVVACQNCQDFSIR